MDFNSAIYMGIYFLLGIILLGFWEYMYDHLDKSKKVDDTKNDLLSVQKQSTDFFYGGPIKYIYNGIKNKDPKAIIIFILFIAIFTVAIMIGNSLANPHK